MKLHLNYDMNNNNGVVFNSKYTSGALFKDVKPRLSFEYESFRYSEVFPTGNYVMINSAIVVMNSAQEEEVRSLARGWVQPLGQEGNLTDEQKDFLSTRGSKIETIANLLSSCSNEELDQLINKLKEDNL